MSRHTPGPWRLAPHYQIKNGIIAKHPTPGRWQGIYEPIPGHARGSRSSIIAVGIQGAEVDDYWLWIKEADARLIEAAPDLLAALQALLAPYKGLFSTDGHLSGCDMQTIGEAFAAVAKASGEPEGAA